MAINRGAARISSAGTADRDEVDAFMAKLDHPLKSALELVRTTIRGARRDVVEALKWNAPSFCLRASGQFFATASIHPTRKGKGRAPQEQVIVVLHQDAKVAKGGGDSATLVDPTHLLERLSRDRCVARFTDLADVRRKRTALRDVVREWLALL